MGINLEEVSGDRHRLHVNWTIILSRSLSP